MQAINSAANAIRSAWQDRYFLFLSLLFFKFVTFALIAPAIGLFLNFSISLSSQSALTDQDIARFLFTPLGFVAATGVASLIIVSSILYFASVTIVIARGNSGWHGSFIASSAELSDRIRPLLAYAALLFLRVVAIAAPFVLLTIFVASQNLSEFDINYYLAYRPPEFFVVVGVVGFLLILMASIMVVTLLSWALSLHLVLFGNSSPWSSFQDSAAFMRGRRVRLASEMAWLFAVLVAVSTAVAFTTGFVVRLLPLEGGSLKLVLTIAALSISLWLVLQNLLESISTGSAARLLLKLFGELHQSSKLLSEPIKLESPSAAKLFLVGAIVLGIIGTVAGKQLFERIGSNDNVEIIAHRGAAGARPENTMAAIQKAIEDGADWVEIDVQETADGEVVVIHDSDLMKIAGENLKIWDANQSDLSNIDIGSWFSPDYSAERVPTLREVLETAKGKSKVLIELKYYGHDVDLENRVAVLVEEVGMMGSIATMSLKYPAVEKMKSLRPDWSSGVLAATSVGNLAKLSADFIAISAGSVSSHLIDSVHAANKTIYVWTVNDPLEMSSLISKGVDGLITDEPALLREVLNTRATLNTTERLLLSLAYPFGLKLNVAQYRDESP